MNSKTELIVYAHKLNDSTEMNLFSVRMIMAGHKLITNKTLNKDDILNKMISIREKGETNIVDVIEQISSLEDSAEFYELIFELKNDDFQDVMNKSKFGIFSMN